MCSSNMDEHNFIEHKHTTLMTSYRFYLLVSSIRYVFPRRRLHKLVKLVSYPFCLYQQIKLLITKYSVRKNSRHNIVQLREVFTTKAFGDNCKYTSHKKLQKDDKVLCHLGFKSKVLPGPLTDVST
jgi:hypothetical protein